MLPPEIVPTVTLKDFGALQVAVGWPVAVQDQVKDEVPEVTLEPVPTEHKLPLEGAITVATVFALPQVGAFVKLTLTRQLPVIAAV